MMVEPAGVGESVAAPASFYVVSGTLPPNSQSYVEREADKDLLAALLAGEYCFVLNSRQMGKSSLSVRTMAKLNEAGVKTVFLDLTRFGGGNVTPEQWYIGLLSETGRALGLRKEFLAYWKENQEYSLVQRYLGALHDVALTQTSSPLVLFIDEIDAVKSLSFGTDEFFAAIREGYNRRVHEPEYGRLAFALVGSATASDLIKDTRTSPFNIGRRIELKDFTLLETLALAEGIARPNGKPLVERAFHWTNGHPFLTQALCAEIAQDSSVQTPADVDRIVSAMFFEAKARERNVNLADVGNRILSSYLEPEHREEHRAAILDLYAKVLSRRQKVADEETSRLVAVLKLSGITRSAKGELHVRNRIYARVFDTNWIAQNMPDAELRRQKQAYKAGMLRVAMACSAVALMTTLLAGWALTERGRAWRSEQSAKQQAQIASEAAARAQLSEARQKASAKQAQTEKQAAVMAKSVAEQAQILAQAATRNAESAKQAALLSNAEAGKQRDQAKRNEQQANTQKQRADQQRHVAQNAEKQADDARRSESEQRRRAQRLLYPNFIARTQQALAHGSLKQAQIYLNQAQDYAQRGDSPLPHSRQHDPRGWEWHYLASLCRDQSRLTLTGHLDGVVAVASSADCIASLGLDQQVRLWEAGTGRLRKAISVRHAGAGRCLLFTHDGQTLLVGMSGKILCYDVGQARERESLPIVSSKGVPLQVCSLAFSPDEKRIVIGLHNGIGYVWDWTAKRQIGVLRHFSNDASKPGSDASDNPGVYFPMNGVAWSPDGQWIATGCGDYEGLIATRLWKASDLSLAATLGVPRKGRMGWGRVNSLTFSPDSKTLITGAEDQSVRVWDIATRQAVTLDNHANNVTSVIFSPDKKWLASGSDDGTARLWQVDRMAAGELPAEVGILYGHSKGVKSVAFSADSHTLITGSGDKSLKFWDVAQNTRPAIAAHQGMMSGLVYTRDGTRFATACCRGNNVAKIWDAQTHIQLGVTSSHRGGAYIAFAPDGNTLAVAGEDGTLTLCDGHTGHETGRFPGIQEPLDTVVWSSDGRWLATGGRGAGYHVRLWDVASRTEVSEFARHQGHVGWVLALAFSPDSKMLVSGGGAGELRWWDVVHKTEIGPPPVQVQGRTLETQFVHRQNIFSLAFSPDGRFLVTGSEDNTARLWDTRTRKPIHLLPGHKDIVYAAAFTPEGKTLATGSKDGTIRLWSLSSLQDGAVQDMVTLQAGRDSVTCLAFSPDGKTLLAGLMSGYYMRWHTNDDAPANPALAQTASGGLQNVKQKGTAE